MSRITIRRTHGLSQDKALAVAKKITVELAERRGIVSTWSGNSANIKGTGISGKLSVEPKQFDIELKLGLFLVMFRDEIQSGVEAKLDELLAVKSNKPTKSAAKKRTSK